MPTCRECGVKLPRLQWTHFKYKCTGRFKNGTEYLKVYPYEKLVDDDISKKTAVTLPNLIKKYGEEEGYKRWTEYKKKQAYSNSYDAKKEKYGWSKEDFKNFNKSRAVTLTNLINKHGEEKGLDYFLKYCERQAYTCTREYFISEYGNIIGNEKFENFIKIRSCSSYINANLINGYRSSLLEQKIFNEIVSYIDEDIECQFVISGFNKPYDFGSRHKNKLIEVYGSYWHLDPRIYKKDFIHPTIKKSASEIWKKDESKRNFALENGYQIYVIWESDWNYNSEKIINDLKEWYDS